MFGGEQAATRRGLAGMSGRDPADRHRAATPLELLLDLAFVAALGQAADELARQVADAHLLAGLLGFTFGLLAISWAWLGFAWFSSAYDTDDWGFRLWAMVHMVGVLVLALGLPAFFASVQEGSRVDARALVGGYVIMRVALVALWLRAARQDPSRRRTTTGYVALISMTQVLWVVLALLQLSVAVTFSLVCLLFLVEVTGPVLAERKSLGTPWHPHHIAERYGLFVIIALGEGVFGTVATVSSVVGTTGWSAEAVLLVLAGIGLVFGLWWTYFTIPSGEVLAVRRDRRFGWAYGHLPVFASVAAVGAGLHVAAYVIEGKAQIGTLGAVVSVAVPVLLFTVALLGVHTLLLRELDPLHLGLLGASAAVLALAVWLAAAGAPLGACLLVVVLAPVPGIVCWETVGRRHQADALQRVLVDAGRNPG